VSGCQLAPAGGEAFAAPAMEDGVPLLAAFQQVATQLTKETDPAQRKQLKAQLDELRLELDNVREQEDAGDDACFDGDAGALEAKMRSLHEQLRAAKAAGEKDSIATINAELAQVREDFKRVMQLAVNDVDEMKRKQGIKVKDKLAPTKATWFTACMTADTDALKRALESGISINSTDSGGHTGVSIAAMLGWNDVVNWLVQHSADVNATADEVGGLTPLHRAVQMENDDCINSLLDAKADIMKQDLMSKRPFGEASDKLRKRFKIKVDKLYGKGTCPEFVEDDQCDRWEVDLDDLEYGPVLGKGGSAAVYRGLWRMADVTIKEIDWEESKLTVQRSKEFKRELDILVQLRHPNLVLFMGAFTQSRPLRFICELCAGGALYSLLHEKKDYHISWRQKGKMCLDTIKGLYFLHTNKPQIIHRDMKSLNLLLSFPLVEPEDKPIVKITDFGIAKAMDLGGPTETVTDTAGGSGTFWWMAPEILQGSTYDDKLDMYSFGITMFEILARRMPFEEETGLSPIAVAIQVTTGKRPNTGVIGEDCPPLLMKVMKDCWEGDPADRPSSKEVFLEIEGGIASM